MCRCVRVETAENRGGREKDDKDIHMPARLKLRGTRSEVCDIRPFKSVNTILSLKRVYSPDAVKASHLAA